jgi:hypothetical protein
VCQGGAKKRDMKRTIIVAFIYEYCKHNLMSSGVIKTWTVGNRNFSIGLSLGSWFTVVAMGIVDLVQSSDNDTPAKW